MEKVHVWEEIVTIPTYEAGKPDKNPMFLEKRVYQGSSGKVYPLPVIETISDEKTDKEYQAVFLENKYLKVMILPELGGRIQRAYDKTNGYDFVYYNEVIKPALVGLAGPWISGGIEFNWPQHHRPTTFAPTDYATKEHADGSRTVMVSEVDVMYGTKGMASFTLYPDKAYIEIKGQLYNRTPLPQTFLWWANPAVAVNDHTYSVFPPDVSAVYDHGKRDVSAFPIAKGTYYKVDYSKGVDISRYKNIPVPTSYMAYRSDYDFVGGYDEGVRAGILHIADHHISPGKKQWTWGCGDFGKAWDRNLTDGNGPYIELMTGVFTDNQPDFTWLKPFEEKCFTQYFMPYKEVGMVKNAELCGAIGVERADQGELELTLYMTGEYENLKVCAKWGQNPIFEERIVSITPEKAWKCRIPDPEREGGAHQAFLEGMEFFVYDSEGSLLLNYEPKKKEEEVPEPAKPMCSPEEITSIEELYLCGLHLEQYRHATCEPEAYYLEGLKRDEGDIRLNTAYGTLLLRRGQFEEAKQHFKKAAERAGHLNPNPYDSEALYLQGLCDFYLGNQKEAYDAFRKAAWSKEQQENSFYYASMLLAQQKQYEEALSLVEQSLVRNSHNMKARGLRVSLFRKQNKLQEAILACKENLYLDAFDYRSIYELICLFQAQDMPDMAEQYRRKMTAQAGGRTDTYLELAIDYGECGFYQESVAVLNMYEKEHPMISYYLAYFMEKAHLLVPAAKKLTGEYYCFPNKLWDIMILTRMTERKPEDAKAWYYLGILWYDKKQYEKAMECYRRSAELDPEFPTVHRNLALYYYNKADDKESAKEEMETAFAKDPTDARVFMELDQLYKKLNVPVQKRLAFCDGHKELLETRDDLYTEYITLLNLNGEYEAAYKAIMNHKFHPWEGGEGKISEQYVISLLQMAKEIYRKEDAREDRLYDAADMLLRAKRYPENLGEGKLAGAMDNHLDYYLGCLYEKLGRKKEAETYLKAAAAGELELGNAMYYNDQPADRIFFKGLALKKLGQTAEAAHIFGEMKAYGKKHSSDEMKIDFFAVSLPDFLIFDEDLNKKNRIHCHYLTGLGEAGCGDWQAAEEHFQLVREEEHAHNGIAAYVSGIREAAES